MLGLERFLQSNDYPASEIILTATYLLIRPASFTCWLLLACPFPLLSIFLHFPIDFLFADFPIKAEVPCVPFGKMSNPRLSRVYLYPENQWYPFLVMRQNISAPTAMVARPVGVNTAAKFTNGLTTQMLLICRSPPQIPTGCPGGWS